MAQAVAGLAAVGDGGADGQVVAQSRPVYRDARVHARVSVQGNDWKGGDDRQQMFRISYYTTFLALIS